eukprot:evm.model.NODE_3366_length_53577_cov_19.425985.11
MASPTTLSSTTLARQQQQPPQISPPAILPPPQPQQRPTTTAAHDYDDAYYHSLLNRVDAQLSLAHSGPGLATLHGMRHDEGEGEAAAAAAPPATLCAWLLTSHTVMGTCWHLEVENTFTRPLKIYFFLSSLLLVFFMSVKIRLATTFAEFLVVATILNAFHYGQRRAFFRFQTSLFLWPFFALGLLLTLGIWDLVLVVKSGAEGLHHEVGVAIITYLFGFLLLEVLGRAVQWQRHRRKAEDQFRRQRQGGRAAVGAQFEEYSIL